MMPPRSAEQRGQQARRSILRGSLDGRVASARPVRERPQVWAHRVGVEVDYALAFTVGPTQAGSYAGEPVAAAPGWAWTVQPDPGTGYAVDPAGWQWQALQSYDLWSWIGNPASPLVVKNRSGFGPGSGNPPTSESYYPGEANQRSRVWLVPAGTSDANAALDANVLLDWRSSGSTDVAFTYSVTPQTTTTYAVWVRSGATVNRWKLQTETSASVSFSGDSIADYSPGRPIHAVTVAVGTVSSNDLNDPVWTLTWLAP